MCSPVPSVCATGFVERKLIASLGRIGPPQHQRGASLVVGMILMVLITMLGLTTLGTSLLEERMAANARDRIRAFEAAEAALRLCESAIDPNTTSFSATGGDGGMFNNVDPGRWQADWAGWEASAPTVREYAGLPLVASQPRCIAERLAAEINETPGAPESLRRGLPVETARTYRHYRVTARGVGLSERTVVMLQSHLRLRTD